MPAIVTVDRVLESPRSEYFEFGSDANNAAIDYINGSHCWVTLHWFDVTEDCAMHSLLDDVMADETRQPSWSEMVDHWVWALTYFTVNYGYKESYEILHEMLGSRD